VSDRAGARTEEKPQKPSQTRTTRFRRIEDARAHLGVDFDRLGSRHRSALGSDALAGGKIEGAQLAPKIAMVLCLGLSLALARSLQRLRAALAAIAVSCARRVRERVAWPAR
jgi:hypothetical protein